MKLISLKYADLSWTETGVRVWYRNVTAQGLGTVQGHPHNTPHYYVIAHRCGYGDDVMAYCREHEFFHEWLSEIMYDTPSPVLWALANGRVLSGPRSIMEELLVQAFQRWVRANERPIVSGGKWDEWKAEALRLLDAP